MRRSIEVPTDVEGLCYDPERARREGLYEELHLVLETLDGREVVLPVSDELMETIIEATDLGVNVPPGDPQVSTHGLQLHYQYDYGTGTTDESPSVDRHPIGQGHGGV